MRNADTEPTQVDLKIENQLATLTLQGSRGIQILSAKTREQMNLALDEISQHPELRLLVITGSGRTFLAGANVHEFLDLKADSARNLARAGQQLMTRIASLPMMTVAAINGACVGGGLEMALACDLRLAIRKAKVGFPEVTLGLLPCWGGTIRASHLFGPAVASRLILEGELITARAAEKLGVIDETCPAEQWEEFLSGWIDRLLSRGPLAQKLARRIIRRNTLTVSQLELGLAEEVTAFVECVQSGQVQKGVNAFLAKESPRWDDDNKST